MSFKASGPKTRPNRVKPLADPVESVPLPSGWSATTNHNTSRHRRSSNASTTSTTSFHSATSRHDADATAGDEDDKPPRFSPDEEASMISTSNSIKQTANTQFAAADYSSAISTYDKAVAELPSYLDYELAVLQSNIAACHLKLEQWKEALEACESGLNGLEREMPMPRPDKPKAGNDDAGQQPSFTAKDNDPSDAKVVELPDTATEADLTTHLQALQLSDARRANITRIRLKLLLRRARARSSLQPPTWSHLAGALEDYKLLSSPEYLHQLPLADQRTVRHALTELPGKVNEAKDREVGEMMGKLKELGNGILRPFGLSTDMFKMVQDQKTGGWSMNFDQGGKAGGGGGGGDGDGDGAGNSAEGGNGKAG